MQVRQSGRGSDPLLGVRRRIWAGLPARAASARASDRQASIKSPNVWYPCVVIGPRLRSLDRKIPQRPEQPESSDLVGVGDRDQLRQRFEMAPTDEGAQELIAPGLRPGELVLKLSEGIRSEPHEVRADVRVFVEWIVQGTRRPSYRRGQPNTA